MRIISHHETSDPAIPRTLARALRRVAARDDVPVSAGVKKLLEDPLVAEVRSRSRRRRGRERASRGSILAPLTDPHCAPPVDEVPTRGGVLVRLGGTGRSVSGR